MPVPLWSLHRCAPRSEPPVSELSAQPGYQQGQQKTKGGRDPESASSRASFNQHVRCHWWARSTQKWTGRSKQPFPLWREGVGGWYRLASDASEVPREKERNPKPCLRHTVFYRQGHAKWAFAAQGSEAPGDGDSAEREGRGPLLEGPSQSGRAVQGSWTPWSIRASREQQREEAPTCTCLHFPTPPPRATTGSQVPLKPVARRMPHLGPLCWERQGKPEENSQWRTQNSAISVLPQAEEQRRNYSIYAAPRAGGWETGIESSRNGQRQLRSHW